MNKISTEIPV